MFLCQAASCSNALFYKHISLPCELEINFEMHGNIASYKTTNNINSNVKMVKNTSGIIEKFESSALK